MKLNHNKNWELSWLLPYGTNGTKKLTGIDIDLEWILKEKEPEETGVINTTTLLSNLLIRLTKDFEFNVISLNGNNQNTKNNKTDVNLILLKSDGKGFRNAFKKLFIKAINKLRPPYGQVNLRAKEVDAKHYHILQGTTIFQTIEDLSVMARLKKVLFDIKNISTGEMYNNWGDLSLTIECGSENEDNLNQFEKELFSYSEKKLLDLSEISLAY